MDTLLPVPAQPIVVNKVPTFVPKPPSMAWAKWTILGIVLTGGGLVAIAPLLQPTTTIYLPPNTQEEQAFYNQQIRQYSQKLTQPNHTAEDHLLLADALANAGERESATQAYLEYMSHEKTPHRH